MAQAFRDQVRDILAAGNRVGIGFWLHVLVDVARSAWREQLSARAEELKMSWIWHHFGVFAGLVLGGTAIVAIVGTNVLFPSNESDSEYTAVYLLGYASLLLVFAAIGFLGSHNRRILSGTRAGTTAALLGGAIALAAFFAVDNLFLSIVSQQVDKIQGFHQSTYPTMRAYINADLLRAVLIGLPLLGIAGAVCGTLGGILRRLIPASSPASYV
jgi:hypothetical protein